MLPQLLCDLGNQFIPEPGFPTEQLRQRLEERMMSVELVEVDTRGTANDDHAGSSQISQHSRNPRMGHVGSARDVAATDPQPLGELVERPQHSDVASASQQII